MGIMVLRTAPKAFSLHGNHILRQVSSKGMGPLFFCLVLQKLVATIASDEESSQLLYYKWYMDDGVVAGSEKAVARVIAILKEPFRSFPE